MTAFVKPWTIILAAGASRRFNGVKALAPWEQGTLLSKAIASASQTTGNNVLVVTGAHRDLIVKHLDGTSCIYNPQWQSGMGTSIAVGVKHAMDSDATMIVLLPIDQPLISAQHLLSLIEAAGAANQPALSRDKDVIGPPAAFPSSMFGALCGLYGDQGFKSIITDLQYVTVETPNGLRDADTPEMLAQLALIAAGSQCP